jgi:hypothetical protein
LSEFKPRVGFDWSKVTWGRPDSVPTVLCSYCSASLNEDDVPLILWNAQGFSARFCEKCMATEWGFETNVDRKPPDLS